jgi:hypothetical protein
VEAAAWSCTLSGDSPGVARVLSMSLREACQANGLLVCLLACCRVLQLSYSSVEKGK